LKTAFTPPISVVRAVALASALVLAGCATPNPAIQESRSMLAEGRIEDSVLRLERAMLDDPADKELRTHYFRERDRAVGQLLSAAATESSLRRYDAAQDLFQRVLRVEPTNGRATAGLQELVQHQRHAGQLQQAEQQLAQGDSNAADRAVRGVLLEDPGNPTARALEARLRERTEQAQVVARALRSPFAKPITLEFRDTPLRTIFEVISRSAGVNFVFDKDVRADLRATIFVRDSTIDEVVRLLLMTHQLERKLLNENSVLVYPNTAAKNREYTELVTRSFYLANADVKQAQALVRSLVKTRDIFTDEKLGLLVIKDTPDAVRLAERLLESLDMAEPEVMLDVEVLEITRSKLQELGLRFPDQIGYGLLQPTTNSTIINNGVTQTNTNLGGSLASGFVDLRNRSGLTPYVANPALMLNLRSEAGDGNLLANPRIRVKNREKARIHIGEKLPVFTTTSTANVGVSASVTYLDVGLKLEVEPNVYLENEVAIKVGLEVSSIVREVPGPSSSLAYQVGTRSVGTVLRLRNGETQVLAGLISDEERSSANRVPGLGEVPVLGRMFRSQRDNNSKTEIVLLITPRIVRNITRPDAAALSLPAGSEGSIGAPPLQLRNTAPRALSIAPSVNTGAGQAGARPQVAPLSAAPVTLPMPGAAPAAEAAANAAPQEAEEAPDPAANPAQAPRAQAAPGATPAAAPPAAATGRAADPMAPTPIQISPPTIGGSGAPP
jgi:general secretion pathway protein D